MLVGIPVTSFFFSHLHDQGVVNMTKPSVPSVKCNNTMCDIDALNRGMVS